MFRAVKGYTSCASVKKVLFMQIVTEDKFTLVYLSLEEAAVFVHLWEIVPPARFIYDVGPNPHEWVESCYFLSKWRFD